MVSQPWVWRTSGLGTLWYQSSDGSSLVLVPSLVGLCPTFLTLGSRTCHVEMLGRVPFSGALLCACTGSVELKDVCSVLSAHGLPCLPSKRCVHSRGGWKDLLSPSLLFLPHLFQELKDLTSFHHCFFLFLIFSRN